MGNKFEFIKFDDDGFFNDLLVRKLIEGVVEDLFMFDLMNVIEVFEEF